MSISYPQVINMDFLVTGNRNVKKRNKLPGQKQRYTVTLVTPLFRGSYQLPTDAAKYCIQKQYCTQ